MELPENMKPILKDWFRRQDKMHLFVLAEGVKPDLDRWINDLLAQYYDYDIHKGKPLRIQLAVREVKLLDLVFPKPCLDEVLSTIAPYGECDLNMRGFGTFRRILKLKPIDKIAVWNQRVFRHACRAMPIGIKEDVVDSKGVEKI